MGDVWPDFTPHFFLFVVVFSSFFFPFSQTQPPFPFSPFSPLSWFPFISSSLVISFHLSFFVFFFFLFFFFSFCFLFFFLFCSLALLETKKEKRENQTKPNPSIYSHPLPPHTRCNPPPIPHFTASQTGFWPLSILCLFFNSCQTRFDQLGCSFFFPPQTSQTPACNLPNLWVQSPPACGVKFWLRQSGMNRRWSTITNVTRKTVFHCCFSVPKRNKKTVFSPIWLCAKSFCSQNLLLHLLLLSFISPFDEVVTLLCVKGASLQMKKRTLEQRNWIASEATFLEKEQ